MRGVESSHKEATNMTAKKSTEENPQPENHAEASSGVMPAVPGPHKPDDDLRLGGHGKDGDLFLLNRHGKVTVHLDGESATAELGGNGADGSVVLSDGSGTETIRMDGKTGEIRIRDWSLRVPDYVFESGYALRSMDDVHAFIEAHGHLPDVPSAREVQRDGVDMTRFSMTLLQKIEELTLYALDQGRTLRAQSERIAALESALGFEGTPRGHSC